MRPEAGGGDGAVLGDLVQAAAGRLAAARVPAPRREALRLLADLLQATPAEIVLRGDRPVGADRAAMLMDRVERRARGEPLAYVTGIAGFRRLILAVDRRVLIPRPETEGLVDRVLGLSLVGLALDVATGSGCLALSLRQEGGYRAVVGLDRSREALAVAAANRDRLRLDVELGASDLVSAVGEGVVDVLVSNPPYVSEPEMAALESGVRDYEPRSALESGEDGLAHTRRLLDQGWSRVRPGGGVALEIASNRARESAEAARALGWSEVRIDEDLFGRARYLVARRGDER